MTPAQDDLIPSLDLAIGLLNAVAYSLLVWGLVVAAFYGFFN